jgi:hypothetical protein
MKTNISNSRRKFIETLTTGATVAGLSLIPVPIQAKIKSESFDFKLNDLAKGQNMDKALKDLGNKAHPVAYDMSQANPCGLIWSNVYYLTNKETGTPGKDLGILNVLRHHGTIFGFNDETIAKYKLGEYFRFNDPITKVPTLRNPYYDPEDGVFPLPGLTGIKGLQENGSMFCICDMARKVHAQFISQKMGLKQEDVYKDFVTGTLLGIEAAPSGVWVLGRLAENKIAYIDASVG